MSYELHVFEVRVDFKYDLEEVRSHFLSTIKREIGGFYPGKHGKATMTLLFVRSGTHLEFGRKLVPILEKVRGVNNHWVSYAPESIVAMNTPDPFADYLKVAWQKAREGSQHQNMRKSQPFRRVSERKV